MPQLTDWRTIHDARADQIEYLVAHDMAQEAGVTRDGETVYETRGGMSAQHALNEASWRQRLSREGR